MQKCCVFDAIAKARTLVLEKRFLNRSMRLDQLSNPRQHAAQSKVLCGQVEGFVVLDVQYNDNLSLF